MTGDDLAERAFAFGWWLVLSVAAVGYVWAFAASLPTGDDWVFVPVLSGAEPLTLRWLWEPLNEHRLPLGKLALYLFARASGGDYRAAMYGSALLLAATTLLGLLAARRARAGRTEYTDAFLPLVMLSWAHRANLLWNIQFFFVAAASVVCAAFFLVLADGWRRPRWAWPLGAVVATLPLQGGMGLAATPALAGWAALAGWRLRRSEAAEERRAGFGLLAGAGLALGVAAVYLWGHVAWDHMLSRASTGGAASGVLRAMSTGLGPPPLLRAWRPPAAVVGVLGLLSVGHLALVLRRRPQERLRAAGLALAVVAGACVVAAIGAGRSPLGVVATMATRYSILTMLLPLAAYCAWVAYRPVGLGRLVPMLFLAVALVSFSDNMTGGFRYGAARRSEAALVLADVRAGMPPPELARRHPGLFFDQERLARGLEQLRRTGTGPYQVSSMSTR